MTKATSLAVCLVLAAVSGCSLFMLPPMEEQKAMLAANQVKLHKLSSQVFLDVWGKPGYAYRTRTQFMATSDGNFVPRFRLPIGEPPKEWNSNVVSDDAVFFAYPERGELLGFIDSELVYREKLSAEQLHAMGEVWKKEDRYRTTLEGPALPAY